MSVFTFQELSFSVFNPIPTGCFHVMLYGLIPSMAGRNRVKLNKRFDAKPESSVPWITLPTGKMPSSKCKKSWSRTLEATLYPYSVVYICNKKFPIKKKGSRHLLQTYLVAVKKFRYSEKATKFKKQPPNFYGVTNYCQIYWEIIFFSNFWPFQNIWTLRERLCTLFFLQTMKYCIIRYE